MIKNIVLNPDIITSRSKYLFILSHMRSRSTVLSHILGSNINVCGYRELRRSYYTSLDLLKMKIDLHIELKSDLSGKYLLDKVLHNHHVISDSILSSTGSKIIVLIREPESTIKSIINMGRFTGNLDYMDPEKATDYYCSRINNLIEYVSSSDVDFFNLNSDELVNNTDCVLDQLTDWLKLDEPLEKFYRKFHHTGKPTYGDPLGNINSGKIVKTRKYSEIIIPDGELKRAKICYDDYLAILKTGIK